MSDLYLFDYEERGSRRREYDPRYDPDLDGHLLIWMRSELLLMWMETKAWGSAPRKNVTLIKIKSDETRSNVMEGLRDEFFRTGLWKSFRKSMRKYRCNVYCNFDDHSVYVTFVPFGN
jgi:hypothetical protein